MIFDRFEGAIQALPPACAHYRRSVIGRGGEVGGEIFCCASCPDHRSGLPDGV